MLFQETKWLTRLGIEIPAAARELCIHETKFKQYKSNLEMLLQNYKRVVDAIPDHLLGLFEPHIQQTLELTNSGCFILTWNSLNIDSFLKQMELGIKKLSDLLAYVKDSKEAAIMRAIEDLNDMHLFDYDMAFTKKWTPEEFLAVIGQSIQEKRDLVSAKITLIENEIAEIGNVLLVVKEINSNNTFYTNTTNNNNNHNNNHNFNGISVQKVKKAKMFLKELLELEPRMHDLKRFYANILYYAMYNCIWNSLKCLAESCGYELDNSNSFLEESGEDYEIASHYNQKNTSNQAGVSNDLMQKYMRVKSAELSVLTLCNNKNNNQQKQNRPVSATTAILKSSWSDERKLAKAFLNLEFNLKYTIPDVVTEPNLEMCEKTIKTIALNLIEIARTIHWINPIENQGFYQTITEDENIKALLKIFNSLISGKILSFFLV